MANVSPSRGVTNRRKSGTTVLSTRAQLGAAIESMFGRFPGVVRATLEASILFLAGLLYDWLDRSLNAMVSADLANAAEQGDNSEVRARRDAAVEALRNLLFDLRDGLAYFFGDALLPKFGFESRLSDDPVVLQQLGTAVVGHLKTFEPPPTRRPSLKWDNEEWLSTVEPATVELKAALEEVAKDVREDQLTESARREAIAAYDLAFRATAYFLVGLFTAAGREDLAERVRPSSRRPGETAENAPTEGSVTPATEDAA